MIAVIILWLVLQIPVGMLAGRFLEGRSGGTMERQLQTYTEIELFALIGQLTEILAGAPTTENPALNKLLSAARAERERRVGDVRPVVYAS